VFHADGHLVAHQELDVAPVMVTLDEFAAYLHRALQG